MFCHEVEVLARVKRGGSLDPRMNGIRSDDVEFVMSRQQVVTSIIKHNFDSRIVRDVIVFFREKRRHDFRYERFDLADHNSFDAGVNHKRSRGYARAESHHQNRSWLAVQESA